MVGMHSPNSMMVLLSPPLMLVAEQVYVPVLFMVNEVMVSTELGPEDCMPYKLPGVMTASCERNDKVSQTAVQHQCLVAV